MDQLVNVIFDIKFVIGISVLLVILVIWLIVNTIRSKGFKKELNELKKGITTSRMYLCNIR